MTLLDLHFQIIPKKEDHYNAVTNLGGLLLLILKNDPRQRQNRENYFAFGAFAQNLMLLLYEAELAHVGKHLTIFLNLKYVEL